MCGVGGLNELLCEGDVVAYEDVDVLLVGALGFLCLAHVYKTTLRPAVCQGKMVLPMGIEPISKFLENFWPATGPREQI